MAAHHWALVHEQWKNRYCQVNRVSPSGWQHSCTNALQMDIHTPRSARTPGQNQEAARSCQNVPEFAIRHSNCESLVLKLLP